MQKEDTILAVDIGAESLKFAEFSFPRNGGIVLENFALAEYGGDLSEEESIDSLTEVFQATVTEAGFNSKHVHLSISGQSAFVRFVKLPPLDAHEDQVGKIIEYEARQNIPFPMSEVVWDYQLISTHEEDPEIEVMFVAVKNELIENITNIIEESGMEVTLVEIAPVSCYNSSRANELGEEGCVMLLNIGSHCSSLIFIDNERFFVRSIPIAGHAITHQISKEFGISFTDAEEMKRRHGFVALGGAYEEPDSEVSATVSKIVRNVMTRLHNEINRSINVYRSQQKGGKPIKLFLAGGSSVMAFTPRFFSEKLRIPVEYFNPFHVISLSDSINREGLAEVAHMCPEVIGLGLRHAAVCPIEISIVPEKLNLLHQFKQKIPYFYASAASLLLCLGLTLWGFWTHSEFEQKRAAFAGEIVQSTKAMLHKVDNSNRELRKQTRYYGDASKILERRNRWVNLFNELQKVLPDRMWLTEMKKCDKPQKETSKRKKKKSIFDDTYRIEDIFNRTRTRQNRKPKSKNIEWIEIAGHSLCEKGRASYEELLRKNLLESPMFTDNGSEIVTRKFDTVRENMNITTFRINIKLKTPIIR